MKENARVKIVVESGVHPYIYNGYTKGEDDFYIFLEDERIGLIRIAKSKIIVLQEVTQ